MKKLIYPLLSILILSACKATDTDVFKFKTSDSTDGVYEISEVGIVFPSIQDSTVTFTGNPATFIPFSEIQTIHLLDENYGKDSEVTVEMEFTENGRKNYSELNRKNLMKQMLFVLDKKIITYPYINEPIDNGMVMLIMDSTDFKKLFIKQ